MRHRFQFANDAAPRCECTNVGAFSDDGWAHLAPFGDFPGLATLVNEDGSSAGTKPAVQRLDRAAADALVAKFRSPWSRIKRWARGLPIFLGHPDDPARGHTYPDRGAKGMIVDLEVRDGGLYARPVFNNEGQRLLEEQQGLSFSVRWSADPVGDDGGRMVLRPVEILSAGLTRQPNLPVQAVNESPMDLTALRAALKRLGITVADDADLNAIVAAVTSAADAASAQQTQAANDRAALTTAQGELATVRGQLTAEQAQVTTLRTELANERSARATLLIDAAIREGRVTEAQRAGFATQFANDFAAGTAALAAAKPGTSLPQNSRVGDAAGTTATLATRQRTVQQLVNDRMKAGTSYDDAFAALRKERPDLFGEQPKA